MKLGITTNYTWFGPPITEIARTIEALGFESMWMGEHPVIPVAAVHIARIMESPFSRYRTLYRSQTTSD